MKVTITIDTQDEPKIEIRTPGRPVAAPTNGNPDSRPPSPLTARTKQPIKCQNCGDEFYPLARIGRRAKFCSKECRQAAYNTGKRYGVGEVGNVEGVNVHRETNLGTGETKAGNIILIDEAGNFTDPWDCLMCRNANDLCDMHEKMTEEGKTPPGYARPTTEIRK